MSDKEFVRKYLEDFSVLVKPDEEIIEKINEIKQLIETIKDDSVLDTLVEQEFVSKTYIQKQDGEYRELNSPDQFEGEFNMLNHMQEDLNMSYPVVLNLIRVISKGIPHYNHKDST